MIIDGVASMVDEDEAISSKLSFCFSTLMVSSSASFDPALTLFPLAIPLHHHKTSRHIVTNKNIQKHENYSAVYYKRFSRVITLFLDKVRLFNK